MMAGYLTNAIGRFIDGRSISVAITRGDVVTYQADVNKHSIFGRWRW